MTAKEMFEKLGFKLKSDDDELLVYEYDNSAIIEFDKKNKLIGYCCESFYREACYFTVEEFKATIKQVEELGWNDVKTNENL